MFKRIIFPLIAVTGILILLTQCKEEVMQPIPKSMKEQLALLPSDANALGYINIRKIHKSEFKNMFMDSTADHPFHDEEYREFVEATGLDLEKDITDIYVAANIGDKHLNKDVIAVINGKFNPEKILDYIKKEAETKIMEHSKYKDKQIYKLVDEDSVIFTFVNNGTLIVGNEERIKAWMDKSAEPVTEPDNKLISQIDQLKYKESAWFTMETDQFTKNLKKQNNEKLKSLESLKQFSLSMDMDTDLNVHGESQFTSDEKAKLFYDAVKGVIAAGKLTVTDDREVIDILNSIEVSQDDQNVAVDIHLTQSDIEKLKRKRNELDESIISSVY